MAGLMASIRIGVVTLLAAVLLNAAGVVSLGDVSAAGEAGMARVPDLFNKDKDDKGGGGGGNGGENGNGNGGDNGQGKSNGNGNGNSDQDVAPDDASDDDADEGNGKKDKDEKKDKDKNDEKDKKDKGDDAGDESGEADDDSGDPDKNPQSGNVDCDDVDAMIEYLTNRNLNGAIHANENGADNAALGALNKCRDKGGDEDSDEDGTPVSDEATPVSDDATPVAEDDEDGADGNVRVTVEIDENGIGVIEYDLDGDGEVDLTAIVEDGEVVEYVEAGADDGTPEASPEAA